MMSSAVDVRRATFCGAANTDVKKGRAVAPDLYKGVPVANFIRQSPKRLTTSHLGPARTASQPTNQSLSLPNLVQGNLGPSLWHDQSRPSA